MNGNKYLSKIDGLTANNRLLGFALILMLVWNIYNWHQAKSMQAKTQTIIQPIGGEGMLIAHDRAGERYIRRMARYITQQLGSYTAATARDQFVELVDLFPPDKAIAAQVTLEKVSADIERFPSISSHSRFTGETPVKFTPSKIQITTKKTRLVNGTESRSDIVQYCIDYTVEESQFWILNIDEKTLEEVGNNADACILGNRPDTPEP